MQDRGAVGLIAGWGSFPVEVAQQIRVGGRKLFIIGIKDHADQHVAEFADEFRWKGVLRIGAHRRFFSRCGVTCVVLAGKIFKDRILHQGRGWIDHLPDLTCCRLFYSTFITRKRDGRDDTLLSTIVAEYERNGMNVLPVTEVAPGLLTEEGCLTACKPSRGSLIDANFGWSIARSMGGLDVGQSVTVKDQMILGVEAIEGTDALIARTGKLCPRGGFTLVKLAKPNQDMRFDVPTIGRRTIEQMIRSGGRTVVVEAGKTILVEREATLALANQHRISIVSLASANASNSVGSAAEEREPAVTL